MAVLLAGTTEGINLGSVITVTKNRSAMSASAWFNASSWSGVINQKIFGYSIGTNASNSRFTCISRSAAPGQLQVGARALDADGQSTLNSTTVLSTGVWHHVVAIVNYATYPSAPYFAIYIDGELDVEGAGSIVLGAAASENTNSIGGGIGVREGGAGQQGIAGLIEDFRLYDGMLGPSAVTALYTAKGKDGIQAGLLHRYPLSDLGMGQAVASAACIAEAERIVGLPLGAPTFAGGVTTQRMRQKWPRAAGR